MSALIFRAEDHESWKDSHFLSRDKTLDNADAEGGEKPEKKQGRFYDPVGIWDPVDGTERADEENQKQQGFFSHGTPPFLEKKIVSRQDVCLPNVCRGYSRGSMSNCNQAFTLGTDEYLLKREIKEQKTTIAVLSEGFILNRITIFVHLFLMLREQYDSYSLEQNLDIQP